MKTFTLVRREDVSGVSGVGAVAEGVQFHDGQCVLSWFGRHHTLEISPGIIDLLEIHGHEGKTGVQWDGDPQVRYLGPSFSQVEGEPCS